LKEAAFAPRWMPPSLGWLDLPPLLLRLARGDPLVVSFPKSGRTWLRVMLDRIGIEAEYTHFGAGVWRKVRAEDIAPRGWWVAHRPTLLMVRDPRDTLVSAFHQATKRRRTYQGPIQEYLRDPRFGIEKVVRWNLQWAEFARSRSNLAIVSYEALHEQGWPLLGAVARHLGQPAPNDVLVEAWAYGGFDAMKERERSGAIEARYRRILEPRDAADPSSFKVRKGVVGGYREELTAEDVAYCAAAIARFEYEEGMARALRERGLSAESPLPTNE
jgi:Sulfotransferase domain